MWNAPELGLLAFYSLQQQLQVATITGGEDLTATGDGDTCKVEAGL